MQDNSNLIVDFTLEFAIHIVTYCDQLDVQKKFVLSRQLLRSGTAIGASAREAQNAESKADFIHKFKIAAKEAEETEYWLLICKKSPGYPDPEKLLTELKSIQKVINKIIATLKKSD